MQTRLVRGLRTHDPTHELGDALRLRCQRATTPPSETDVTPVKPADRDALPRAREPAGDRGCREHRGAKPLERERRREPHAVELGLRLKSYTRGAA